MGTTTKGGDSAPTLREGACPGCGHPLEVCSSRTTLTTHEQWWELQPSRVLWQGKF